MLHWLPHIKHLSCANNKEGPFYYISSLGEEPFKYDLRDNKTKKEHTNEDDERKKREAEEREKKKQETLAKLRALEEADSSSTTSSTEHSRCCWWWRPSATTRATSRLCSTDRPRPPPGALHRVVQVGG